MVSSLKACALALLCSLALVACSVTPDPIDDSFPSSISEVAHLESVSYSGRIGDSPMSCEISLVRLNDGSVLVNSGYAPLRVWRVTSDGRITSFPATSIGAESPYYVRCFSAASRAGIAVVTGFPTPQIWLFRADGSIVEGDRLPEQFVPEKMTPASDDGFIVIGRVSDGADMVVRVGHDLKVAWTTSLEGHSVLDATTGSNGTTFLVGHAGRIAYASEMSASFIILGSTGEVISVHEFSPRRWNLIHQIEPLPSGRYLLIGENQGGGYTHTWIAAIDSEGQLLWHNEDLWDVWQKASMPKRVMGVIEDRDGTIRLLSSDVRLSNAGADQKTTIIDQDGSLRRQVEWDSVPGCRPVTRTIIEQRSAYLVYSCRTGTSLSGYVTFEFTTTLQRLR